MIKVTKTEGLPKLELLNDSLRPDLALSIDKDSYLHFRVSGFTQVNKDTNSNRQAVYELMYRTPVLCQEFAVLHWEQDNKYDENSISVRLVRSEASRKGETSRLYQDLEDTHYHIGYVPRAINKQLLDYYSNFESPDLAARNIAKTPVILHQVSDRLQNSSTKTIYSAVVKIPLDVKHLFQPEKKEFSRFNYIDED